MVLVIEPMRCCRSGASWRFPAGLAARWTRVPSRTTPNVSDGTRPRACAWATSSSTRDTVSGSSGNVGPSGDFGFRPAQRRSGGFVTVGLAVRASACHDRSVADIWLVVWLVVGVGLVVAELFTTTFVLLM